MIAVGQEDAADILQLGLEMIFEGYGVDHHEAIGCLHGEGVTAESADALISNGPVQQPGKQVLDLVGSGFGLCHTSSPVVSKYSIVPCAAMGEM